MTGTERDPIRRIWRVSSAVWACSHRGRSALMAVQYVHDVAKKPGVDRVM
jgi:hypothetical protein